MEEKIKYVLNGETKYYTYEELKAYYIQLLKNSGGYFEKAFNSEFKQLVDTLKKHDGDPYGDISNKESYSLHHNSEALGFIHIIR